MKFGSQTTWMHDKESIDDWLKRENEARDRVENPTCPYCDAIHNEWWEFEALNDPEVSGASINCSSCGRDFLVNKETQVRFETMRVENNED